MDSNPETRRELLVRGLVQGVGFRPFVHRLASRHRLAGSVRNEPAGVRIVIEGAVPEVDAFVAALTHEAPPLAVITSIDTTGTARQGESGFRILPSETGETMAALVPPDVAVCERCRAEMRDPTDRRYRYPFLNCTDCGPRFTLIEEMPYDRPGTTMRAFTMCPECRAEYDDLSSRRYHAQPNACPRCGPRLVLRDADGRPIACEDGVAETVCRLAAGEIGAIKGIGGFHLACDATNEAVVRRLRERKHRPHKPLAIMVRDLETAERLVCLDPVERTWLTGWRRPIVLGEPRRTGGVEGGAGLSLAPSVCGASGLVGVMLPYAPLHDLLFEDRLTALVMTSANRSDEPIACGNEEAVRRLGGIADFYLEHDRGIHQRMDDPVVRVMRGFPALLRRSRGFVPEPVPLPRPGPPVLAVGGDLKNVFCVTRGNLAFCGPYIGDLAHPEALALLEQSIDRLLALLKVRPAIVVHDLHPDYHSTRCAERLAVRLGVPRVAVQHHRAHLLSVLAEHGWDRPALGLALDGVGYGEDGTAWGGELLLADGGRGRRLAHLAALPLPGGDSAAREPWRMALAVLGQLYGPHALVIRPEVGTLPCFTAADEMTRSAVWRLATISGASPMTSSAGRLVDAAASLLGLRQLISYEGQAAAELEAAASAETGLRSESAAGGPAATMPVAAPAVAAGGPRVIAIDTLLARLVNDALEVHAGRMPRSAAARRFHLGLAAVLCAAARVARDETGVGTIALSGGVMQNRLFTEELAARLEGADFHVLTHRLVPPNDGGIALGQAWGASLAG